MPYPCAFFTRVLEDIFLFSTCYEVVNFQSKEPKDFFFCCALLVALWWPPASALLHQFLSGALSTQKNKPSWLTSTLAQKRESYFLNIIFLEGKQLPEQLGLPQKALTCGAIVSPVKKQIFCSCQEKENKMLWNIKIINKIISTLHYGCSHGK